MDIVSLIQSLLNYCRLALCDCSAFEVPRTELAFERIYHKILRFENYDSSSSQDILLVVRICMKRPTETDLWTVK